MNDASMTNSTNSSRKKSRKHRILFKGGCTLMLYRFDFDSQLCPLTSRLSFYQKNRNELNIEFIVL